MIVVASNLHGNVIALNSLLEKVERLKDDGLKIRGVYILGVLGYMPYPKETYETIVKNGVIAVRGKFDHL
ncbi:MAG: metallophosphatase family protein, partial [Desulfocapsa sp.]